MDRSRAFTFAAALAGKDADGNLVAFEIKAPRLYADSAQALMAFAHAGCGVALLPEWLVRNALNSGFWYRFYRDTRLLSRASMPFIQMPSMCPLRFGHLLILCVPG